MTTGSGLRTFIAASILIVLAAATATYVEYRSFDPCAWMVQDMAEKAGLRPIAAKARVQGRFLVKGIVRPDAGQCVLAWWAFRSESASEGS